MAANDCAIVVGVARYFQSSKYPPLQGPVHDVKSVYEWLISKSGGDVPDANIRKLVTEDKLFTIPNPQPENYQDDDWQPSAALIQAKIFSLIFNKKKELIYRPNGRLYMYFSGHGFTDEKVGYGAALFTADAGGNYPSNVGGTLCAEAIAKMGVFGQIVLIMDCCRDALYASSYGNIFITHAEAPGAQYVPRFEIYAGPKGSKAQEGELEPGGPTAGYLTNAVLTALRAMPPNVVGKISASRLDNYIAVKWGSLVPNGTSPPKPRIHHPYSDQTVMYFLSGREDLVDQEFSVSVGRNTDFKLWLESSEPHMELPKNEGTFTEKLVSWTGSDPQIDVELSPPNKAGRQTFTLRLLKIPHNLVTSMFGRAQIDFIPGGQCVDL